MTEATTPANAASAARQHGRRLLFALAVLAVVIAPVILLNQLSRSAQAAADLVAHTYRVEAAASRLAWTVRDVESAALLQAISGDVPLAATRVAEGRRALPGQIEALARLTADNPRQQMRIGRLAELVESRLEVVQQVQDASPAQRAQTALALVDRFPIRGLLQEIMAEESRLLSARNADAERRRLQARWLGWGAMLAQLVLLGAITWLLWRQIGDRMRAQAQGRTAEVRAQTMLQTVRDPIALIDKQQRVVMHNSAFAELYGEVQPMQRLIDVGNGAWRDPVVHQRLSDVLARGRELWDLESAQTTADGVSRTLMLNARRMQLPDSEESVALLTLADVSAQKATQQRLDEVNRQLSGKVEQVSDVNRELEAFSYSVSHDLRAPLRHVSGFADKLARHLGDSADDKSKHYVEVISTSARRMSQLIDDLLVYSRLGRSAMRLQAADMQSLVSETRALLDANAEAEGRTTPVQWRIAPLPIVVCDENMMRQVWLNLLGNAVKYSARSPQPVVEVGYERLDDGGHQFVVRDNGAGFDMAYAGKLFGVFQRLHKASEYPGTGIGLASVRRVLGRHGGRIWAESAPGQGAAFHFVLPAALDAPVSDTQPNENPT
jgi:PAS domain S-box-containing protein